MSLASMPTSRQALHCFEKVVVGDTTSLKIQLPFARLTRPLVPQPYQQDSCTHNNTFLNTS